LRFVMFGVLVQLKMPSRRGEKWGLRRGGERLLARAFIV
jgi:hypothetical protein